MQGHLTHFLQTSPPCLINVMFWTNYFPKCFYLGYLFLQWVCLLIFYTAWTCKPFQVLCFYLPPCYFYLEHLGKSTLHWNKMCNSKSIFKIQIWFFFFLKTFKWCWSSHFFPFPNSYHHNLNLSFKTSKNMGLEKINVDIEMNLQIYNFHFKFQKNL